MATPSQLMITEAIAAARAGDRARARNLLSRLLRTDSANAECWVWMSAVVDTDRERVYCLESALKLDPTNRSALRGLVILGARKPADAELTAALRIPKQYNYHGLKKSDIREIWMDLFDNYKEFESTHLFSRIVSVGPGDAVEITCSGGVRAVSKISNLRVPIDSWYGEVHYMVREDGTWKIRGNLGDVQTVLPFGTAPHPLF